MDYALFAALLALGIFCGRHVGKLHNQGIGDFGLILKMVVVSTFITTVMVTSYIVFCASRAEVAPAAGRIIEWFVAHEALGLFCVYLTYFLSYNLKTEPEVINFDKDGGSNSDPSNQIVSFLGK